MKIEKTARINIISEQWTAGEQAEPIKLMSIGKLQYDDKRDEWTVSYDESEATGMEGTKTSLRLTRSGNILFSRSGSIQMKVLFESGNHYQSQMETPYGLIDVSIMTNEARGQLSERGGEIVLAYSLNLPNQEKVSTKLNLQIEAEGVSSEGLAN